MIFAGDFAQLRPTTVVSLYNNAASGMLAMNISVRQQENTIGKLLWQQVTTVVNFKERKRARQSPGMCIRSFEQLWDMQPVLLNHEKNSHHSR